MYLQNPEKMARLPQFLPILSRCLLMFKHILLHLRHEILYFINFNAIIIGIEC